MRECGYKFPARNNLVVAILVLVLMASETGAACHLHGFSPQGDALSPLCSSTPQPVKREALPLAFRNSFLLPPLKVPKFSRGSGDVLTREIHIKQGKLRGVVREFKNEKLKNVETYLGIPYAAPPVKNLRFMPPGSPPTWKNVKIFEGFGPACPQTPPDLVHEPFKTMNAGYFNRLKGLVPFLANQSEDCLYLNIYAPARDNKFQKYPVIVYIHGESFEWNSGNPYDGSILASYGNVVVVTLNFRLGILGFLRPGLSEHTVSNFGLLDQIAALQWIKDNIEEFGGDPSSVTLMGHGTGAACINFLMVSPVSMASQGLFHKAILMSGTALSDWALTHNPLQFTIQVAEALNCPLIDKNDELSNCLRRKRLSEIMGVKVTVPEFQTPFGPIVDGSVVPNTPHQVMGVYQNLFTRYDLLYGITEWETYHSLDPVSLTYGMLEGERNDFLRKFMYSRYEALPFFALATTLSEYLDWRKGIPPAKSAAEEHRDLVLDLLSDARYAAPVVQMALYHSRINPKSYLYVFKHKSKMGEFAGSERSISGEEIPYVFGVPLVNEEGPLAHHKFSASEQLLSKSILTYFTNFVKTGNPNAPRRLEYLSQGPREWQQIDIYWPEYDSVNQTYLSLEIPLHVSHHYRSQMTQYWNEVLPDLLSNPTKLKQPKPEIPSEGYPRTYESTSFPRKEEEDSGPWTYGTVRMSPKEYRGGKHRFRPEKESASSKQMDRPPEETQGPGSDEGSSTTSVVPYFVAVTLCLLAINAVVLGFYFYKKKKTAAARPRDLNTEEENQKTKDKESVYSVMECMEESKTEKPTRLKKCLSDSKTVKKWIQEEILDKYSKNKKTLETSSFPSPKTPKKPDSISLGSSRSTAPMPKPILKNARRICQSNEDLYAYKKSVQKVSVGVDATPSTRGDSVLKQTPIEITKSLDRGLLKMEPLKLDESSNRSRTSVSLQMLPKNITSSDRKVQKPQLIFETPKIDFRNFLPKDPRDINVTSRQSEDLTGAICRDPLENIQKRNFPKVLPDLPQSKEELRLSFPQFSLSESNRNKSHPPPPPPPRVSTLQKKSNQESEGANSKFQTFSSINFKKGNQRKGSTESSAAKEDDSESSTEKSDSCKSVIVTPQSQKKREPSIVIQPKIGPRRSGASEKNGSLKKAHIDLQSKDPEKSESFRLDSKGPSDKVKVKEKTSKSEQHSNLF